MSDVAAGSAGAGDDLADVHGLLRGTAFEARGVVLDTVDSTIDECVARAESGAPEGTFVLADGQRRGRGQQGRSWFSPPGASVYLSALLRPSLPPAEAELLTLVGGLAACETLREDAGVDAFVKRPNDLVVNPTADLSGWRKLGGVVVDTAVQGASFRHAIVSVGLNVSLRRDALPAELRDVATSVVELTGRLPSRAAVAGGVLVRLSRLLPALAGDAAAAESVRLRHASLAMDLPEFRLPRLEPMT